jgi:hypothetical protein
MLLSEVSGVKPSARTFQPSDRFVCPTTAVGIEIELENMPHWRGVLGRNNEFWSTTSDGSLRNHGIEFVSKPLFGKDIELALATLNEVLEDASYVFSSRTGLHIHIDVSGMSVNNLLSHSVGYALLEPALYKYVGEERRQNIYCLPIQSTANLLPYFNLIKYGRTNSDIATAISAMCKYSGFNLRPIMEQGSVEYRHHTSTIDPEEIIRWINIIMKIRKASEDYLATDLAAMDLAELQEVLVGEGLDYTRKEYEAGYILAKDILNFTHLKDGWDSVQDLVPDYSRINFV